MKLLQCTEYFYWHALTYRDALKYVHVVVEFNRMWNESLQIVSRNNAYVGIKRCILEKNNK